MMASDDAIDLARDVTIIRMRARNVPWRSIGRYLGTAESTLRRRYESIPLEMREAYRRTSLDL